MMTGLIGIAIFLVTIAMSTLGSVLLLRFILGDWSRGRRVLLATLMGPGLMLIPFSLVALFDGGAGGFAAFFGISVMGMAMCGIISWPVAHFSTKKLDRLTVFDVETFQ